MLFSATFDGAVAELARAYTVNPTHVRGALPAEAERGEIDHAFVLVTAENKLDRLVEHLRVERGLALVFVRTKHGADKLVRKLVRQHQIPAVAMHGNLSQNQRERALAQFESGRVSTLVATDVAARGLDVDDITHVINFDPPHGHDDYVHRIGRTGRAGRSGNGVTFVLPEQQHGRRPSRRAPRPRRAVRRIGRLRPDPPRPAGGELAAAPPAPPLLDAQESERDQHPADAGRGSDRPGGDGLAGRASRARRSRAGTGRTARARNSSAITAHRAATARRRRPCSPSSRSTTASPHTTTIPVATVREWRRSRSKP